MKKLVMKQMNLEPSGTAVNMAEEQTFGMKAVGITFNPSGDYKVNQAKQVLANAIDQMNNFRNSPDGTTSPEQKRLASIAITELQGAQMWMVKALTWKD